MSLYFLTDLQRLCWIRHFLVSDLCEVDETRDVFLESEECAVVSEADDSTFDLLAHRVALGDLFPWVLRDLLDTEGELLAIDADDLHLHAVTDLCELGWVLHVTPCDFGDVNETLEAIEGNEETELHDATDETILDVTDSEAFQSFGTLFRHRFALGDDDLSCGFVERDDLDRERVTDELTKACDDFTRIGIADAWVVTWGELRDREEGADAVDVGKQTTLVGFLSRKLHRLVIGDHLVEAIPCLLLACHTETHDDHAFVVLFLEHESGDSLTCIEFAVRIERIAEFATGDDTGGYTGEIEQHLVLALEDDSSFHELSGLGTEDLWGILQEFLHHCRLLLGGRGFFRHKE